MYNELLNKKLIELISETITAAKSKLVLEPENKVIKKLITDLENRLKNL